MSSRTVKVLHLITDLQSGGAQRTLSQLVGPYTGMGIHHVVVSMTDKGFFGPEIERAGVPLYALGIRREIPGPWGLWRLLRILREEQPDVLQTWLYHADLLGLIAGRFAGIHRIAWNVRCSNMDLTRSPFLTRAVFWLLVHLSSLPDAIVVNSRAGLTHHIDLGYRPPRWEVIPNGVDVDHFRPDPEKRRLFRARIGAGDDDMVAGMVARLNPQKDHRTFLDALARLAGEGYAPMVVLVGRGCGVGGNLVAEVTRRNLDRQVVLLGEIQDITEIMCGIDVLVLTSAYGEGSPNTVAEAMASGVPVVATDVGDVRDLVADTGRIIPPEDTAALAEALRDIAGLSMKQRMRLGSLARTRIKKNYEISTVHERYKEFYQEPAKKT